MGRDSLSSCMERRVRVDKFLRTPVSVLEEGADVIVTLSCGHTGTITPNVPHPGIVKTLKGRPYHCKQCEKHVGELRNA
jgi:hypothetical protein